MRGKIKKKTIHNQRNKQESTDSKKSASPSSSSQKDIKIVSLFKIQNIEKLRKLQRLSLSKEVLERMVQKRSLDIIKQINTSKGHVKRSFIVYTFNPLTAEEHNHFLYNNRQRQRKVSLIDALSQLKGEKSKNGWAFEKLRERTEGRIDNALNYKYKLQKDIIFSSKAIVSNQKHQLTKSSAKQRQQILQKSFLDLDKIIVINDSKVRITNKQQINIFQVLFKKRRQIFIQIDSLLLRNNFYFQSVQYGLAKQTKINPYKDISIYNRYFITNQPAKIPQMRKLAPINMSIVLPRLNSNDLLLIASGKLSPPILAQYVNLHVQQNNDYEQQRYLLKQNQLKNQKNNPIFTNRVDAQVSAQLNLSAAEKEWKLPTNNKFQYLQQLQDLIASERVRNELQIKDRQLRVQLKDKKQRFLIELLNRNSPNKYKNVSNKIMLSKMNKDCFQSSRNKSINQTFKRYKDQLQCDIQQNRKKSIDTKYRRKNITESNSPIIKRRKLSADNEVRRKSSIKANKSLAYYD